MKQMFNYADLTTGFN